MGYLYYGLRQVKSFWQVGAVVAVATVTLVSATTGGSSHAAVWMGVSTLDGKTWLQAGVEKFAHHRVAEYIEVGKGGRQVSLRTWPTTFGHKARIRLFHRGSLWRISIDGHWSRWTWVPSGRVNTLALLETYRQGGAVRGVAIIDGHRTRSH